MEYMYVLYMLLVNEEVNEFHTWSSVLIKQIDVVCMCHPCLPFVYMYAVLICYTLSMSIFAATVHEWPVCITTCTQ